MPGVKASVAMISREFARNNPILHSKGYFHKCHDILHNVIQIIVWQRILEEKIFYFITTLCLLIV